MTDRLASALPPASALRECLPGETSCLNVCNPRRSLSPESQAEFVARDILDITHSGPNASVGVLHSVPYADAAHTVFLTDDHYGRELCMPGIHLGECTNVGLSN